MTRYRAYTIEKGWSVNDILENYYKNHGHPPYPLQVMMNTGSKDEVEKFPSNEFYVDLKTGIMKNHVFIEVIGDPNEED